MKEEKNKNITNKQINQKEINKAIIIVILILVIAILIFVIQRNVKLNSENSQTNNTTQNGTSEESYVEEIEPGVKINKSTKLNEAKDVNGLLVTNIQLSTESGMTTLLADVTNNTGTRTEVQTVNITLLDQEGQELTTVTGIIDTLEVGETTQLNIAMTTDYINAYDFAVEL